MKIFNAYKIRQTHFSSKLILLTVFWISFLLSIGALPEDIFKFGDSFFDSFNSLRISFPLIAAIALVLYFVIIIFINHKKEIKVFEKKSIIFFMFLLYLITQIIGLFLRNYDIKTINLDNAYLVILSSGTIINLFLVNQIQSKNITQNFFYLTLFIIFFAGIILLYNHLTLSSLNESYYLSLYNSVPINKQFFLNHELPRVTGISRTLAILNVSLICFYFNFNKKKYKLFILTIIFLISFIIFLFESRGTILCYSFTIFFFLLISKKIYLINKIKFFIVIIIIPIFIFQSSRYLLIKNFDDKIHPVFTQEGNDDVKVPNRIIYDKSTSGRTSLWINAIENYDKKKIFGYGSQGDRFLLKGNIVKSYSNNVSNAFIYAFLSGGYFGLIFFFLFFLGISILIFKKIFKENLFNNNDNYTEKIAVLFIFFFIIRAFFENSFGVFGIDFIIVIISSFLLIFSNKNT